MPYTKDNYPAQIKSLPKGARTIWINTFNKVLEETDDENKARQAAWRNVKLKYKKSGDKWVKKSNTQESINRLSISNTSTFVNLVEGSKEKAIFRVIKPGWSENGFYYPKDVTPQLVSFIEQKPMFFNRHLEPEEKKKTIFGQQLPSAVALAEKAWANEDGEVFVELKPLDGPNKWIYEAAIEHPGIIGNSIDAYGKVKLGEAEGKKGKIVESFTGYNSTDFVYRPAAGGKFVSFTEAIQEDPIQENILEAISDSFAEYIKKYRDRVEFWEIGNALSSFLYSMLAYTDASEEEKQKIFEDALNDFIEELKRIDPPHLFEASKENFHSKLNQLESKLGGNFMLSKELLEELKNLSPEVLKASAPSLYKQVQEAISKEMGVKEELKKAEELQEENKQLLEKVTKLTQKTEELESKLKEKEKALEEATKKQKEAEWKEKVDQMLTESKIKEELITEKFKERLYRTMDEKEVQEMIEDRKEIQEKALGKVNFDNKNSKAKKDTNTQEASKPWLEDDDLLAKQLTAN